MVDVVGVGRDRGIRSSPVALLEIISRLVSLSYPMLYFLFSFAFLGDQENNPQPTGQYVFFSHSTKRFCDLVSARLPFLCNDHRVNSGALRQ